MDQRIRIAAALGVLLMGFVLALFFRNAPTQTASPVPAISDPLVFRKQPASAIGPSETGPILRPEARQASPHGGVAAGTRNRTVRSGEIKCE